MHIPDGFINAPTSLAAGAVAAGGVGVSLRRTAQTLQERQAPLAGLVAAYIFAVQMLNFPIFTSAVSGHLLGGALAAMLVGPWIGALCVSVVLLVQALIFSDGGVTALGLNITNMALIGTAAAYLLIAVLVRVLPRSTTGLAVTAFTAAMASVVVASQGFVFQYWLGGAVDLDDTLGAIAGTMAGTHLLIGIGEGLITATTVVTVAKVRPDLVYALRGVRAPIPVYSGGVA